MKRVIAAIKTMRICERSGLVCARDHVIKSATYLKTAAVEGEKVTRPAQHSAQVSESLANETEKIE